MIEFIFRNNLTNWYRKMLKSLSECFTVYKFIDYSALFANKQQTIRLFVVEINSPPPTKNECQRFEDVQSACCCCWWCCYCVFWKWAISNLRLANIQQKCVINVVNILIHNDRIALTSWSMCKYKSCRTYLISTVELSI